MVTVSNPTVDLGADTLGLCAGGQPLFDAEQATTTTIEHGKLTSASMLLVLTVLLLAILLEWIMNTR